MGFKSVCGLVLILSTLSWAQDDTWWRTMQLYQIYPRSFMDSNGDGIGDIQGITWRLHHLKDIGITATWLSPIFPSPMLDFGYDIANYTDIDPDYGTMEDLEVLLKAAQANGIKVLLDFVPNHSSNECEWFKRSVQREPGFENFYVWNPGKINPDDPEGLPLPPSNWRSVFRGSAWTWHPDRQEYYLHQFLPEQPDLNYRDANLVEEMKNVLRFWLDMGVAGFRVDAIPHLFEVEVDPHGNYPDEPLSGNTDDPDDYGYLNHIYTRERDETYDLVYQWRAVLDEYTEGFTRVLLMEAMSETELVMKYYGNDTAEGAHFPFNFNIAYQRSDAKARGLMSAVKGWYDNVPEGRVSNWVIGNHDQPRVASRFGPERSDGIVMLAMLLPGVAVTYQGEEIAMENFYPTWEQTKDPQACKSGIELFNITSRDPERTPFQWDHSQNSGFSTSNETWLPVADNYLELNLIEQMIQTRSHLKMYKELANLRRTPVIQNGDLEIKTVNDEDEVLVFMRSLQTSEDNTDRVIVLINTGNTRPVVDLKQVFPDLPDVLCTVSAASEVSTTLPGSMIDENNVQLVEYDAIAITVVMNGVDSLFMSKIILLAASLLLIYNSML